MTKQLSLKLKEEILEETEKIIKQNRKSRNAYINDAIDFYNKLNRRKLLKKELVKESTLVSENSMAVLREFERFEDNFD